jgi:lambda family phage portal protein
MNLSPAGVNAGTITTTLSGSVPRRRASTSLVLSSGAYHAASSVSQELAGWEPRKGSADADVLPARSKISARSHDLDRNNGWIQGAVNKKADAIVGSNIRLRARPNFAAMGMSAEWADEWSTKVEALWSIWANDPRMLCDVERHNQFGGLVKLAYNHWCIDGEAAVAIYFIDGRGGMMSTAALVVDPDRISNPNGRPDGKGFDGVDLRGGVELDEYGAARAYWVRNSHPGEVGMTWEGQKWTRIPREDPGGRPRFIHAINKRRAHQHRSVGVLAANMGRMKNLDTYDRYELGAALRNQAWGMYVESPFDSDFVKAALAPADDGDFDTLTGYQGLRAAYHEKTDVRINGVPLAHLLPGEKIETVSSENPTTNFEAFQTAQLAAVASPFGLATEQLSGRWAGINYSNARTLTNETWRGWISERHTFGQALCTPIYAAWLEEAVARDLVECPGGKSMFYVFRAALTRCEWIGPARGTIDKLKEGKGDDSDYAGFRSTLEAQCAERGLDWRDVLYQRKREQVEMERYGLTMAPATGNAGGGNDDDDPDLGDPDDADRRETAGEDA